MKGFSLALSLAVVEAVQVGTDFRSRYGYLLEGIRHGYGSRYDYGFVPDY